MHGLRLNVGIQFHAILYRTVYLHLISIFQMQLLTCSIFSLPHISLRVFISSWYTNTTGQTMYTHNKSHNHLLHKLMLLSFYAFIHGRQVLKLSSFLGFAWCWLFRLTENKTKLIWGPVYHPKYTRETHSATIKRFWKQNFTMLFTTCSAYVIF